MSYFVPEVGSNVVRLVDNTRRMQLFVVAPQFIFQAVGAERKLFNRYSKCFFFILRSLIYNLSTEVLSNMCTSELEKHFKGAATVR